MSWSKVLQTTPFNNLESLHQSSHNTSVTLTLKASNLLVNWITHKQHCTLLRHFYEKKRWNYQCEIVRKIYSPNWAMRSFWENPQPACFLSWLCVDIYMDTEGLDCGVSSADSFLQLSRLSVHKAEFEVRCIRRDKQYNLHFRMLPPSLNTLWLWIGMTSRFAWSTRLCQWKRRNDRSSNITH